MIRLSLAVALSRIRARRVTGHAIVCGGSTVADTLTRGLQANGVTVIEIRSEVGGFVNAGDVFRIIGDARDPGVLKAVGVRRASTVYACAESSATNVAIALAVMRAVGESAGDRKSGIDPIVVHSLMNDSNFCATVQAFCLGRPGSGRVRLDFFNLDQIAARWLFVKVAAVRRSPALVA